MRSDPDVKIIANDATFAVTRCTELFIGEHYAEEHHAVGQRVVEVADVRHLVL